MSNNKRAGVDYVQKHVFTIRRACDNCLLIYTGDCSGYKTRCIPVVYNSIDTTHTYGTGQKQSRKTKLI